MISILGIDKPLECAIGMFLCCGGIKCLPLFFIMGLSGGSEILRRGIADTFNVQQTKKTMLVNDIL